MAHHGKTDVARHAPRHSRFVGVDLLAAATLASIDPAIAESGAAIELTATGSGFVDGDVVVVGGAEQPTTFSAATSLVAAISVPAAGVHDVLVRCLDGDTNAVTLTATAVPVQPVDLDTLMQQLKAGDTSGLAGADDNSVISCRSLYAEWAREEKKKLDDTVGRVNNDIVAELARRELTGG